MLVLGGGGNLQCGGYWKVTSGNLIGMVSNSYLHMYTLHVSLTGNGGTCEQFRTFQPHMPSSAVTPISSSTL